MTFRAKPTLFTKTSLLSLAFVAISASTFSVSAQQSTPALMGPVLVDEHVTQAGQSYQSTQERFGACKNIRANIVYRHKDSGAVISSAVSSSDSTASLEQKRESWRGAFSWAMAAQKVPATEARMVESEFYSILNFYLKKNHTLDANRMNQFLNHGVITDVTLSCTDKEYRLQDTQAGDGGAVVYEILYNQKI